MSDAKNMLLHLASDLLRAEAGVSLPTDPHAILEAFKADPRSQLSAYQISTGDAHLLMTMDRVILAETFRAQLLAVKTSLWSPSSVTPAGDATRMLMHLAVDLIRGDIWASVPAVNNLLATWSANAAAVMDAYGLDTTSRAVLQAPGDRRLAIANHLVTELLATESPPPNALWAEPEPEITGTPTTVTRSSNVAFDFVATCVLPGFEVYLQADDTKNHIAGKVVTQAPYQAQGAKITVSFDLSSAKVGDYVLRLYNGHDLPAIISNDSIKLVDALTNPALARQ